MSAKKSDRRRSKMFSGSGEALLKPDQDLEDATSPLPAVEFAKTPQTVNVDKALTESTAKLSNLSLNNSESKLSNVASAKNSSGRKRNLRYDQVSSPVGDYIRGLSPTVKKSKVQSFGPMFPGSPMLPSAYSEASSAYASPIRHASASRRHSERRKSSARKSMRGGSSQKKHTPSSLSKPILPSSIISNENSNMNLGNSPLTGKTENPKQDLLEKVNSVSEATLTPSKSRLDGRQTGLSQAAGSCCFEVKVPASSLKEVQAQDWMFMKSIVRSTNRTTWKKRWIVLQNNMLYVYRKRTADEPVFVALMDESSCEVSTTKERCMSFDELGKKKKGLPTSEKRYVLSIRTKAKRIFYLSTFSERVKSKWEYSLNNAGYETLLYASGSVGNENSSDFNGDITDPLIQTLRDSKESVCDTCTIS